MRRPGIRVVVFREGDWWVAQCLEYDLATQTQRLEAMPSELQRLIAVQIAANQESGVKPFHGFSEAPRRYWELYEKAKVKIESVQPNAPVIKGEFEFIEIRVAA